MTNIVNHKFKCDKCYNTKYIINLNENNKINIDICYDCVPKEIPKEVVDATKLKCKQINEKYLDPEDDKILNSFLKTLKADESSTNISQSLYLFKEMYPEIKRKRKHLEILKNPQSFRIVRPVEDHQFTALHLFTRNQVFQIISKENRAKNTKIDEFGKIIEISEDRTFLGWGGNIHFTISGPVLCDYDQQVFDASIKIWHKKCQTGMIVETNLSEIWKTLGNVSELGKTNRESLRRSLKRLSLTKIMIQSMDKKNKSFWTNTLIEEVKYNDLKENKLTIIFNIHMAENYLEGAYATLNHNVYVCLSSYAKKIYLFLMSHDNPVRQISIDKLRPLIGVSVDISEKHFKEQINRAIKELKEKYVLDSISKIDKGIFHSTVLPDAWDARPTCTVSQNYI